MKKANDNKPAIIGFVAGFFFAVVAMHYIGGVVH